MDEAGEGVGGEAGFDLMELITRCLNMLSPVTFVIRAEAETVDLKKLAIVELKQRIQ